MEALQLSSSKMTQLSAENKGYRPLCTVVPAGRPWSNSLESMNHSCYAKDDHPREVYLFFGPVFLKIAIHRPDISPRFVLPAMGEIAE
jgi:hypothetical protein